MDKLDKFLNPIDSPKARNVGRLGPSDYESRFGNRGGIRSTFLGAISFSTLNGGTATLGGVNDGNGLLQVFDSFGTEVVRLDNTGIVISAGTITGVTVENIDSGTISNAFIGTSVFANGTVRNSVLGTNTVVGGTSSGQVINASTINTPAISGGTSTSQVVSNAIIGTPAITGGTSTGQVLNGAAIGTPVIVGGTVSNPRIMGTPNLDVNTGSAALANNGEFAIQTFGGSAILVARVGGTTFKFTSNGTI